MEGEQFYRRLVDELFANNVGSFVELPQIAVMGDTSSGKLSLLSAISGVSFPANHTLTTRCPIRLRMEHSESSLQAVINVIWVSSRHSSSTAPSTPWEVRKVTSLEEVTTAIAEAQAFVIAAAGREVAEDIVEVALTGPSFVNLTLIDLPGIVRTTGDGESKSLVLDIDALIKSFLCNERCVILAVHPATDDFHNSQIMSDARSVDAQTIRTIPVITKPDLVDPGSEEGVLGLLRGEKIAFELGLHMVKCRNQRALNDAVTIEESIEDESRYFSSHAVWGMLDPSLLGIPNLRDKLARLQTSMIAREVPHILLEVQRLRREAEAEAGGGG